MARIQRSFCMVATNDESATPYIRNTGSHPACSGLSQRFDGFLGVRRAYRTSSIKHAMGKILATPESQTHLIKVGRLA